MINVIGVGLRRVVTVRPTAVRLRLTSRSVAKLLTVLLPTLNLALLNLQNGRNRPSSTRKGSRMPMESDYTVESEATTSTTEAMNFNQDHSIPNILNLGGVAVVMITVL